MGFLVALARGVRGDRSNTCGAYLSHAGLSGFLAFAVVGFLCDIGDGDITRHWRYLSVSAVIGMAGRYQEKLIVMMLAKLGLEVDAEQSDAAGDKAENQ